MVALSGVFKHTRENYGHYSRTRDNPKYRNDARDTKHYIYACWTLGINRDALNRNIGIVIEDISKRSIKTAFALMEGNSDFVLPSFTQICTVTAQTGSSVSVHSIIGAQTSASSVIGTPIGNTQNIYMLKNGIYNAYIKNANASAVRLIIQYF